MDGGKLVCVHLHFVYSLFEDYHSPQRLGGRGGHNVFSERLQVIDEEYNSPESTQCLAVIHLEMCDKI